jgi:hypothetical protein
MIDYQKRFELSLEVVKKFLNDCEAETKAEATEALIDLLVTCQMSITDITTGNLVNKGQSDESKTTTD